MDTSEPDCPFCAIVRGEDSAAREVLRTDEHVAFFPTEPATLGHTMIVPVRHVPRYTDLTEAEARDLGAGALHVSRLVYLALKPEGLNIIQSNGRAAEQTVPHVHVHVVPRWGRDAFDEIWPATTNYSESAKDATLQRLREVNQEVSQPPNGSDAHD